MRNKLIKLAGSTIVAVAMASIALTAMPQAALAAPAVEKATGSIVMGADGQDHNEKQAINFNVFERATNKGNGDVHELPVRRRRFGRVGIR